MENGSLRLNRTVFGSPADRGKLPTRQEAEALLDSWVANERLKLHMRQVGALLETWTKERLNPADADLWYLSGLLHDADWDKWPETHPQKTIAWLEEHHCDPDLIHAVAAHGPKHFGVPPVNELDRMIFAFDELSGFVHAVSLVRPAGYDGRPRSSRPDVRRSVCLRDPGPAGSSLRPRTALDNAGQQRTSYDINLTLDRSDRNLYIGKTSKKPSALR